MELIKVVIRNDTQTPKTVYKQVSDKLEVSNCDLSTKDTSITSCITILGYWNITKIKYQPKLPEPTQVICLKPGYNKKKLYEGCDKDIKNLSTKHDSEVC